MSQFTHLGMTAVKVVSNNVTITNNVTSYSNSFEMIVWAGFAALEVSALTGTVTISQQCSSDNVNWYDPVNASGTALGAIATSLAAAAYIEFDPVLSKYVRLKYVPSGSGAITSKMIISE